MTAAELRLALAIAQDYSIDLTAEKGGEALYGFGLPDFPETHVSLRVVASCLRWQCALFNGGWDWKQFNEDRPHYLRKEIQITDLHEPWCRQWLVQFVTAKLNQHPLQHAA